MMSYLDIRIQELMTERDEHLLRSSQPLGWFGLGRSIFQGRLGWVVWVIMLTQIGLFVVAIWAGVKFFNATEVVTALKYGLSTAVLIVMATQLKLSLMPHIQTERLLRELKRVEILILAQNREK